MITKAQDFLWNLTYQELCRRASQEKYRSWRNLQWFWKKQAQKHEYCNRKQPEESEKYKGEV